MKKHEIIPKTKGALRTLHREILSKMADLFTAAFGVIAALAWNEAIKAWVDQYLKKGDGVSALFQYAVIVTIAGVLIALIIGHAAAKIGEPKR